MNCEFWKTIENAFFSETLSISRRKQLRNVTKIYEVVLFPNYQEQDVQTERQRCETDRRYWFVKCHVRKTKTAGKSLYAIAMQYKNPIYSLKA